MITLGGLKMPQMGCEEIASSSKNRISLRWTKIATLLWDTELLWVQDILQAHARWLCDIKPMFVAISSSINIERLYTLRLSAIPFDLLRLWGLGVGEFPRPEICLGFRNLPNLKLGGQIGGIRCIKARRFSSTLKFNLHSYISYHTWIYGYRIGTLWVMNHTYSCIEYTLNIYL